MKFGKLALGILVGVAAFWLCLKDVQWPEVAASLRGVALWPFAGVVACLLVAYFFRARRWTLLVQPMQKIAWKESFAMNAVGFMSIHLLPFRLGEFTRPYLLKKRHGVPLSAAMAVVLVERVFDGLASTLALFVGLLSVPEGTVEMQGWNLGVDVLAWTSFAIFVPLLVAFVAAVWKREVATRVFRRLFALFPAKAAARLNEMLTSFLLGLSSVPDPRTFARVALETVGVWGVMPVAYWLLLRAFGLELPAFAAFSIMGIAALGVMIPGPPGFVGTFQLFVQGALVMYGASKSVGFAYAMVFYVVNMLFVLVMGVASLRRVATPLGEVMAQRPRDAA